MEPTKVSADEIRARSDHRFPLLFTSEAETSATVVFSVRMAKSIELPTDRQAVGQLLARLLREFRHDLAAPRAEAGFGDIRDPHMQIFGNVRMGGVRLTELADRAQLSLAATSELVNDLEQMGYLIRRPDPADGRAKLIDLTKRGADAMSAAGQRVADIERRWSKLVGAKDFGHMCRTMQHLLDELNPQDSRS
jgi:DNA-binding MarR family transcriptional regulator